MITPFGSTLERTSIPPPAAPRPRAARQRATAITERGTAEPLLAARGLHLRHRGAERDAVSDLHLELRRGEVLALVGPNGSGKSTALAALGRELRPRRGQLELEGGDAWHLSRRSFARRVARLPQEPACPEGLTVEELVRGGRHPHGRFLCPESPADTAAVREALAWVDLAEQRRRRVETLSGGERRRAWLAMVLCQGSEVLLLDEPTTGLDLRHRCEVLEVLRRIRRERGTAIVAVLHDLEMAARLADRLAVMHRGRLYDAGPPERCLEAGMLRDVFGVAGRFETDDAGLRLRLDGPGEPLRSL